MSRQVYRVDTPVIGRIHGYFERHVADHVEPAAEPLSPNEPPHGSGSDLAVAEARARTIAHAPSREHVADLVNAVFWASLVQVEGRSTTLSIAYLPPEQADRPFRFADPLPLQSHSLAKVAPAAERPGIHFGAWPGPDGQLAVWGMTRSLPLLCFVLEVASPGVIVVKHRHGGRGSKFVNAAVLAGDEAKFIAGSDPSPLGCSSMLGRLIGRRSPRHGSEWLDPTNAFVRLALSMRAHHRGGTLLVVPSTGDEWRESVAAPILYAAKDMFTELRERARRAEHENATKRHRTSLARSVDAVAGLTAVDGATIITDALDVVGFGAKIIRRKGQTVVESVLVSEPVEGNCATEEPPSALGGTRHLSAAQFVHDQRNAVAMVASQDGRFTIFEWSERDGLVHAQRIDALLL
jgi:hypothetical protein